MSEKFDLKFKITNYNLKNRPRYYYHIVTPSPWPILTALGVFSVAFNAVAYFHRYKFGGIFLLFNLIYLLTLMAFWWRDVIREASLMKESIHLLFNAGFELVLFYSLFPRLCSFFRSFRLFMVNLMLRIGWNWLYWAPIRYYSIKYVGGSY